MCSSKKADSGWSPQRCGPTIADLRPAHRRTRRPRGRCARTPSRARTRRRTRRTRRSRRKARPLLVGPVDDLDRRERLVAGRMQRLQRLQRAQHAERAVELAARSAGCRGGCPWRWAERRCAGPRAARTSRPCRRRSPCSPAPRRGRGTSRAPACRDRSASAGRCRLSACRRSPRSPSGCPTGAPDRSSGCARCISFGLQRLGTRPPRARKGTLLAAWAPFAALFDTPGCATHAIGLAGVAPHDIVRLRMIQRLPGTTKRSWSMYGKVVRKRSA